MSRKMVNLIHANGFFPNNDAENLRQLANGLDFVPSPYGMEVPNFNLIFPDSEIIFNKVLGERVTVDPIRSGVLRRPNNNAIHYEHFDSPDEWCFIVALEKTTINFWHHIDPEGKMGELGKVDSTSALAGANYNFRNLFEWKIHTNIVLEQNQCLFIRPWDFHSLEDGLVQYYRLIADSKFRILVMGLPDSSKKEISTKLAEYIGDAATVIHSIQIRHKEKDVDYTPDGQMRHCYRLLNLSRISTHPVTIINMTCPIPKMRHILNPDIVVWASDGSGSMYNELLDFYEPPVLYDIECKDSSDETISAIIRRIQSKRK